MDVVVAVLGLGEAGSEIAADLVAAGVMVRGYDPRVAAPPGVVACRSEGEAARGASVVLSLNSAQDAATALTNAGPDLAEGGVYADLNTTSARNKLRLAELLPRGRFVDVALMTPVPGHGIRTPMLAAGPGAAQYATLMQPLGAEVTVLDGEPGAAATRKLLRSVFYKGLAAAVIEALAAAEKAGLEAWLWQNIAEELSRSDARTLDRLVSGSHRHALRRSHEMGAATELLGDLGVPARIAPAARDWLAELAELTELAEHD